MKKDQETKRNRKASKLLKCDGKTLRQIIVSKGYVVAELSRMIGYCDDYLNRCIRRNDISDVCVKKLIDYKIFPQMYDVEGEIKVDEPKEVKINKEEKPDRKRTPFDPTAQEIKKVLNEKYGTLGKGVEGIDYGYGPAPKNPSYYAAGHTIAKGFFRLMQASIDDLKHDPEFKELIKQAVKEAYEEL